MWENTEQNNSHYGHFYLVTLNIPSSNKTNILNSKSTNFTAHTELDAKCLSITEKCDILKSFQEKIANS